MKISELTPADRGQMVSIMSPGGCLITGPLAGFSVDQDWIDDTPLCGPESKAAGAWSMSLTVGRWATSNLDPSTEITIEKSL